MKIEKAATLYIDFLENIKRYSKNTIKSYNSDLRDFVKFCIENNKTELNDVNDRLIKKFLMMLNESGIEKTSITRKLSALRGLFKFCFNENYIKHNPGLYLHNPKIQTKLPEIATLENILNIYEIAMKEDKTPFLIMVIFEILYGCSIRVSELCSLKVNDMDLNQNTLRVFGKGSKIRIVPVGEKSKLVIEEYLKRFPPESIDSPLIRTRKGKKLYPDYVYRHVKKYFSLSTDMRKKSPHVLRHSSATHMLDRGADLMAVKEILGHESLRTTQIYTHVSIERLKSAYKKSHPKS